MKKRIIVSLFVFQFGIGFLCASPGTDKLNIKVANLSEDVSLLVQQVKQLKMDIEFYQQEDALLKTQVESLKQQLSVQEKALDTLSKSMQSQSTDVYRQKQEIIDAVTKQLDKMMNASSNGKKTVSAAAPTANSTTNGPASSFSSDYPKNGVVYTVEKGDTLSAIAQKFKSSYKDIQNANHIANPKDLKVGQVIFIPQKDN